MGRAVEQHPDRPPDHFQLLGLAHRTDSRAVDDDAGARQLLQQLTRPSVLADDPALLALEVVVVAGVLRQVDQVERPEVVVEDRQRRLRLEAAPDRLDHVGGHHRRHGVVALLDGDAPRLRVDVEPHVRPRFDLPHRLAAGADDDANPVLRNRHVLHATEYPAEPFKRVPLWAACPGVTVLAVDLWFHRRRWRAVAYRR